MDRLQPLQVSIYFSYDFTHTKVNQVSYLFNYKSLDGHETDENSLYEV